MTRLFIYIFHNCAGGIRNTDSDQKVKSRTWTGYYKCAAKTNLPAESSISGSISASGVIESQQCARPKTNVTQKDMPLTNHSYEQAEPTKELFSQMQQVYVNNLWLARCHVFCRVCLIFLHWYQQVSSSWVLNRSGDLMWPYVNIKRTSQLGILANLPLTHFNYNFNYY